MTQIIVRAPFAMQVQKRKKTAQTLLIQNWIAGMGSLLFFLPFYLLQSRGEEQMMLEQFGTQYEQYKNSTSGIIPRLK